MSSASFNEALEVSSNDQNDSSSNNGNISAVSAGMNRSGVFMPKCLYEPEVLSSKKDRERRTFRYIPPAPRPANYIRSLPSSKRLFQSKDDSDFDSSFQLLMGAHPTPRTLINGAGTPKQLSFFRQYFEVQERLGFGSFGDVFRVKSLLDGLEYAVKKSRRTYTGETDRKRQLHEVQRVVQIPSHKHLVELERAWEEDGHLFLQLQLCSKSLNSDIEDGHQLNESESWDVLVDMLLALQHLHTHRLVHMDVKPENIFLTLDSPPIYKLGDFGIVVSLDDKFDVTEFTEGDSRYLAPEVMQGVVSTKADVFSIGLTILEIVCNIDLPKGGQLWHTLRSGQNLPEPCCTELPNSFENVLRLMLIPDVEQRPEVDEILKLPEVRKRLARRRWILGILYLKQKLKAIARFWNFILSFLASLVVIPRRHSAAAVMSSASATEEEEDNDKNTRVTPEVTGIPPDLTVHDISFSDDEDILNRSSRNNTPVFASTPISTTRSGTTRSGRARKGELDSRLFGSPSTSRNLLKEFEAVSDDND